MRRSLGDVLAALGDVADDRRDLGETGQHAVAGASAEAVGDERDVEAPGPRDGRVAREPGSAAPVVDVLRPEAAQVERTVVEDDRTRLVAELVPGARDPLRPLPVL